MKQVTGWWFADNSGKLSNSDNRKIEIGKTHIVTGEIIPCQYGLHMSKRIIDALKYAPGEIIYKVRGEGTIVPHGNPIDKYACSRRTYIAGGFNASKILEKFSRLCAMNVVHLWDAPDLVVDYLTSGNPDVGTAARKVAKKSTQTAWDARTAAHSKSVTARRDTLSVAAHAASVAAFKAIKDAWDARTTEDATLNATKAAWGATWGSGVASLYPAVLYLPPTNQAVMAHRVADWAARAAAWDAFRAQPTNWEIFGNVLQASKKKQNARIHKMVMKKIKEGC